MSKKTDLLQSFRNDQQTDLGGFLDFVLKVRLNRLIILSCLAVMILQLLVFKYVYPIAFFINADSYQYIVSAYYNLSIDLYPIGYPGFLRLFSVFSSSDTALVCFQYFFVQISSLCLLFTLDYFYGLFSWLKVPLFVCVICNPAILYMANYISSDSLFLGLSICWFVVLLWILKRPSWWLVVVHAVVIFIAFVVRYNALFYPVVSFVAFLIMKERTIMKLVGAFLAFLLIGVFVVKTSFEYKKASGTAQFSPFSGWQLANNAIYAYKFVNKKERKVLPAKFNELDRDVCNYIDSTRNFIKFPEEMLMANAFYMWMPRSPLRIYMKRSMGMDSSINEFKNWSRIAPLYKEYGATLIKTYPMTFARTYLWTNFVKYYAPPIEFLNTCGFNNDTIPRGAKFWFRYGERENKIMKSYKTKEVYLLSFFPVLCGVVTAVFIMLSISFFLMGGRRDNRGLFRIWMLFFAYWICNLLFSTFASPIALRFQMFSLLLSICASVVVLNYLILRGQELDSKMPSGEVLNG